MEETYYKLMMKNYEAFNIDFIGIFASHHLKHIFSNNSLKFKDSMNEPHSFNEDSLKTD